MQFADFVSTGFNYQELTGCLHYQAYWKRRCGSECLVAEERAMGLSFQTNEAIYKTPGLKVVYPAFPHDAKGLLKCTY
jgi:2-oxoisovalerate dehydrogenase E1 component